MCVMDRYLDIQKIKQTPITFIILIVCVIVFMILEFTGGSNNIETLYNWGANNRTAVIENKEVWRIVTSMFIHIGGVHILANMLSLILFSRIVELAFGSISFTVCWFVAGSTGSIASILLNTNITPNTVSAGASGAIFGTAGAFMSYLIINRKSIGPNAQASFLSLAVILLINIAIGVAVPFIDNTAHLGGLIAGFLFGLGTAPRQERVRLQESISPYYYYDRFTLVNKVNRTRTITTFIVSILIITVVLILITL